MSTTSKVTPFLPRQKSITAASRTLSIASKGITALEERFLDAVFSNTFLHLVDVIVKLHGRVIVTGMGKTGIVARKITATLTSTGTPAIFMHPADAGHGDLGTVTQKDLVMMLSHSGETRELRPIIRYCRRYGIPLASITTRERSTLASASDICIRLPRVQEACPHDLAPTTSTTVQMAFGDALATALIQVRGFSADDFYKFHPKGKLGTQLIKVHQLMVTGELLPKVHEKASLLNATIEMTRGRLGGTAIINEAEQLRGVLTDGDLRRAVLGTQDLNQPVCRFMDIKPLQVDREDLASEALRLMHLHNTTLLFVCEGDLLLGAIHMHQLMRAGIT
ncbi:KpsF/GutQ family sugar-phosphate isomerase [Sphingobium sp. MI1205]|uniref:KpsF/GutQ family sugar-phosphate isomerase n=1 Tax=Sphingobium sp. MI1205 TaxID=407020 RepID=UPI00077051DE|nr:KpsF/GutQ family sugar-phosphate isomerase [Sphingobium sp. MI1205]AMK18926.1 arabinose-5-phosphate isomerase [Sphingobium sp. MI1205]